MSGLLGRVLLDNSIPVCYNSFTLIEKELVMKNLTAYVKQKNEWTAIFNGYPMDIKTVEGRRRIAQSIDSELSPENLTCDGELPRSQVQARYRQLTAAAKELIKLDPSTAQYIYEFSEA
jgi:hypothetical protein